MTWARLDTEAWAQVSTFGALLDSENVESIQVDAGGVRRLKLTCMGIDTDFLFIVSERGEAGAIVSKTVTFDPVANELCVAFQALQLTPLAIVSVDVAFDVLVYRQSHLSPEVASKALEILSDEKSVLASRPHSLVTKDPAQGG